MKVEDLRLPQTLSFNNHLLYLDQNVFYYIYFLSLCSKLPQTYQLKRDTFIISPFLWLRHLGTAWSLPVGLTRHQSGCQGTAGMEGLRSQSCCFTEIRPHWRSAQLFLLLNEPEQPSIIHSYFSTVMLNNSALHTQVKFDKKELFKSLEMPIASLFLALGLSLFPYFFFFFFLSFSLIYCHNAMI